MSFNSIICYAAALLTAVIAIAVLYRDPRAFVHRILAIGLAACALEAGLIGLGFEATSAAAFMQWQGLRLAAGSFLPAIWLLFSLSFGRGNYKEFLSQWKWAILAAFVIPIVLIAFFSDSFFTGKPLMDEAGSLFLRLGWSGYILHLLSLLGAVLVLMNLERTLRHSSGRTRWQVKFMVFGVGGLFGVHVYTDSQVLLYRLLSTNLEVVEAGVLLLADLLVIVSLTRARLLKFDFYVSHAVIYNSLSLLLVGIYFILVGVMARLVYEWKGAASIPLLAFLLFVAIVGLSVLFFSDRLRLRQKEVHQPALQAAHVRLPAGLERFHAEDSRPDPDPGALLESSYVWFPRHWRLSPLPSGLSMSSRSASILPARPFSRRLMQTS